MYELLKIIYIRVSLCCLCIKLISTILVHNTCCHSYFRSYAEKMFICNRTIIAHIRSVFTPKALYLHTIRSDSESGKSMVADIVSLLFDRVRDAFTLRSSAHVIQTKLKSYLQVLKNSGKKLQIYSMMYPTNIQNLTLKYFVYSVSHINEKKKYGSQYIKRCIFSKLHNFKMCLFFVVQS